MVRTAPLYDKAAGGNMVVRAPRRTDAVAGSLRRAYGADRSLPTDIAAALHKLTLVQR